MKKPIVTDHALLRWLERADGINVEALRSSISKRCSEAMNAGASMLSADGVTYVFRGEHVVTVTPNHSPSGVVITSVVANGRMPHTGKTLRESQKHSRRFSAE